MVAVFSAENSVRETMVCQAATSERALLILEKTEKVAVLTGILGW